MKKRIQQNGRVITSLGELVDNVPVRVWEAYTVKDLPYRIEISTGVGVQREVWVSMVREFAKVQEIAAIKWVRQVMSWGLKEAKFFVDGLLEDSNDEWLSVDDKLPEGGHEVLFKTRHGYPYLGYYRKRGGWFETSSTGERTLITLVVKWMEIP